MNRRPDLAAILVTGLILAILAVTVWYLTKNRPEIDCPPAQRAMDACPKAPGHNLIEDSP